MKKEDKEVINVWEKIIEINEDGEIVGYYFQYKQRKLKESEVKSDDEARSKDDK